MAYNNKAFLKRNIHSDFRTWLQSPIRSPLLLTGARQVGKTTSIKSFLDQAARQVIEVNFWRDNDDQLKKIFTENGDALQILAELKDYFSLDDFDPERDALFIDEIQECPQAYSSLKSFKEQIPGLMVLSTGSYLQLFLRNHKLEKLPLGCVDELQLKPLSFEEFLENLYPELYEKYTRLDMDKFSITSSLHRQLIERLNEYFLTGGLPEIVHLFKELPPMVKSREQIRQKQKNLLKQYGDDFSKYGKSTHIKRIDEVFKRIPFQLERVQDETVKRFAYKEFGKNANYNLFHWAFQYLEEAGLIYRSYIVSKDDLPARVHEKAEERNLFKCFYFDIGLLNAALDTPVDMVQPQQGAYKGYCAENFIAQQIKCHRQTPLLSYKKSHKTDAAEIEFLLTTSGGDLVPLEVKSSPRSLRSKSLESYVREFTPAKAFKLIPTHTFKKGDCISIPIYMINKVVRYCDV